MSTGFKRPNFLRRYFGAHARTSVTALGRQWRDPVGTLLSALVIGLTLALPAGLQLLADNLRQAGGGLNQTRTLTLFLRDSISRGDGETLAQALGQRAEVESARYTSRDVALEQFRTRTQLDAVLEALGENPLPASIALTPRTQLSPSDLERLAASLRARAEIEHVQLDSGWSTRLAATLALVERLALVLAVALGAVAVLALGNTIRLDIEARRDEILVMKLVGASRGFTRRPFLYAGLWYGLSGGLIAILALVAARYALADPLAAWLPLFEGSFQVRGPAPEHLLVLVAAGALLGLAGGWLAVARHLDRVEPR